MSSVIRIAAFTASILVCLMVASPVLAGAFNQQVNVQGLPQGNNLAQRISNIVGAILTFVALVAAIGIIYGGFRYITAFGDEDGAAKGKKAVLYSVIGLVIIGLSAIIVNWVTSNI